MLPPGQDRVDRKRGCVLGDPDADETLVGIEVVDPVGDRVSEVLVSRITGIPQL